MDITIRPAAASDTEACGRTIYEAFKCIADRHRFPPDFPTVEAGVQLATSFINDPAIFGVVAEYEGRVVGSNFLDERDPIRASGRLRLTPSSKSAG